ncbi:MAG: homoserine O-acetyltransferase [Flammeovirgaceae bacterium]|jgi:homoserine O-acetyltransferase|nr:homoserine O-acetyltransferase [Gammaproteobacteria bacterium]GIS31999.1 MAG: homoserine O-acetyltransferase [Flammeovirgaceae bacterium]|tara:strand:- start:699 stop:1844 length:1146 start_codon:yes stop_codon:yes gene_type:complete
MSENNVVSIFKHDKQANIVKVADSFEFKRGGKLPNITMAYETWGKLNSAKSNVVVVLTGLSASSHIASSSSDKSAGWWESMVGKNKPINTEEFHVICINTLGSCFGSTSPVTINEKTKKPYRLTFPELSVEDMARGSYLLLKKLGIDRVKYLIGPSLGGMQALALSSLYNNIVENIILISTATQAHPYAIAIRSLQREVIRKDPLWNNGFYDYDKPPLNGVRIARKIGMTSYRSPREWIQRFGRKRTSEEKLNQNTFGVDNTNFEYEIESYLEHHAIKFQKLFDANCYLYLSRAMDWFDLADHGNSTQEVFSRFKIENALVISAKSDTLFPPQQQKEIAEGLSQSGTKVEYKELQSIQGHDSFLVDIDTFGKEIRKFMKLS